MQVARHLALGVLLSLCCSGLALGKNNGEDRVDAEAVLPANSENAALRDQELARRDEATLALNPLLNEYSILA